MALILIRMYCLSYANLHIQARFTCNSVKTFLFLRQWMIIKIKTILLEYINKIYRYFQDLICINKWFIETIKISKCTMCFCIRLINIMVTIKNSFANNKKIVCIFNNNRMYILKMNGSSLRILQDCWMVFRDNNKTYTKLSIFHLN